MPGSTEQPASASVLREAGNVLYKSGKLLDAIEKYREASQLGPEDAAILSNLSAAYFELGNYQTCMEYTREALEASPERDDARRTRLNLRLAKSLFHLQDYEQLRSLLADCPGDGETSSLREAFTAVERSDSIMTRENRLDFLMNLPRYKSSRQDLPEYFGHGHDDCRSLFDPTFDDQPDGEKTAFLFGGAGDARNVYTTLIDIDRYEAKFEDAPERQYVFTLVDIHPATLARNLVILFLMRQYSSLPDLSSRDIPLEGLEILATIQFIFSSAIMPQFAHARLQETVTKVMSALKDPASLPSVFRIRDLDRQKIMRILRSWQKAPDGSITTAYIRKLAMEQSNEAFQIGAPNFFTKQEILIEHVCHMETGLLSQPSSTQAKYDKPLTDLLDKWVPALTKRADVDPQVVRKIGRYLDTHWKPNWTRLDLEYNERPPETRLFDPEYDLSLNPFEFVHHIYDESGLHEPEGVHSLYGYVRPFFETTANALDELGDRVVFEFVCDDVNKIFECFYYGLNDGLPSFETGDHETAPCPRRLYDGIHLSNVPDYIGGPLPMLILGLPVLKPHARSVITSTCLRNTTTWRDIRDFHAEYTLTSTDKEMLLVTGGEIFPDPIWPQCEMPMADYLYWHSATNEKLSFSDLMSRASLERWLCSLFLKIALPFKQSEVFMTYVFNPLNLSMFFRVFIRLHDLGYPSHWLSTVLDCILSNGIETSARPPRSCPVTSTGAGKVNRERHVSIKPFIPEITTLAALWVPVLPFGVITTAMPPADSIKKYSIQFGQLYPIRFGSSVNTTNVLVFYASKKEHGQHVRNTDLSNLRSILVDDEQGEQSASAKRMRKEALIVITTFEFSNKERKAKFWMRQDAMDRICETPGNWRCLLQRTDHWRAAGESVAVTDKLKKIGRL
ncbi:hypothetical protein K402DRAFT_416873 [Aulographum hederae CBS 113979]|uniref:DUF4470 domain-containing protein n=1 Tax=Aulographum hederae CBS 113979 TaxID=1176131 RepID=A0A6G1HET9_9PEZI|nr:hypothetical protein K402DRAFT_416873 [Aulographum hederae CBS 113979]